LKKYLNILNKCPLFFGIADDDLLRMLGCLGAVVEVFDKKYTIFAEGSRSKYVGIILSGSAQVVQLDFYGNRSIIQNVGATELFGEAFACAEVESLPVSVIANEPCEVMFIDCGHILHTCQNGCGFHHQLIFNLMKALAKKSLQFHERIAVTSKRTTREKLLAYLNAQSKYFNCNSFVINFDRQELADYLEVDRSGLSAEISKLRKEGIIDCHKNRFVLL